jgi:outer membrane protein assembly factor BamB
MNPLIGFPCRKERISMNSFCRSFFYFILFSFFHLGVAFSSEVRPAAEKKLRVQDLLLLTEFDRAELKRRKSLSLPSSIYRVDETRAGVVTSGHLPTTLKLDWRVPRINLGIHSASKASPAVDASGIYVGSDSSWFYSYDHSGHLRWRKFVPRSGRGIHATAALDQNKVYFGAYNGAFYALDKTQGAVVWAYPLGDAIGSSPVIYKDHLYISVETSRPADGYVLKIRCMDGKVIWKSPNLGEQAHASPVINEKEKLVYVGANNGRFYGLDLQTGKSKWVFEEGKAIKDTATLIGDSICFGSWSGKVYCLNAQTGKKNWEAQLDGRTRTSPTLFPDLNYLVTATEGGTIYALRVSDGSEVWKIKTGAKNFISSSLVIRNSKDSRWVMWDRCEATALCAISPPTGEILARYPMGGVLTSVPVFFDGALYLSLNKKGGLVRFIGEQSTQ